VRLKPAELLQAAIENGSAGQQEEIREPNELELGMLR